MQRAHASPYAGPWGTGNWSLIYCQRVACVVERDSPAMACRLSITLEGSENNNPALPSLVGASQQAQAPQSSPMRVPFLAIRELPVAAACQQTHHYGGNTIALLACPPRVTVVIVAAGHTEGEKAWILGTSAVLGSAVVA